MNGGYYGHIKIIINFTKSNDLLVKFMFCLLLLCLYIHSSLFCAVLKYPFSLISVTFYFEIVIHLFIGCAPNVI